MLKENVVGSQNPTWEILVFGLRHFFRESLWKVLEPMNRVEWLEERRPDFGERFLFGQDWDRHGEDEFKQDLLQ